jgi:hypothetical protein
LDTANAILQPIGNKKAKAKIKALAIANSTKKGEARIIAKCAKANAKRNEILRD